MVGPWNAGVRSCRGPRREWWQHQKKLEDANRRSAEGWVPAHSKAQFESAIYEFNRFPESAPAGLELGSRLLGLS